MANLLINIMIHLCFLLDANAFSDLDTGSLQAWADPTDGREAIYLHAPPDSCRVTLEGDLIIIDFSDACEEPA